MTQQSKKETWINNKWRPLMAWIYMAVILFDFIIAPVFWAWVQIIGEGIVAQQWIPLTLGAGGLFHMAMGAIIGVTAWSRGKEKMVGVAGDIPIMYSSESEYQQQIPTDIEKEAP